ncbi:flagellar basal body P-ring formation chaperone FlgA [Desulfurobacterium atlanticum]|uniref:Flagella basal body P-ring formation protein FlgA n=1 Tax=Desulfurobacterium atlanticum TaxID=240169 RepID=A0A238ZYT6_9BACT|nr:flagellar basal body P-ring formation chaperone FlgA [Desulfurobacterium atlanticum]SNR88606.1 flagella basal body P-ring formation protein FlgA [Desulfurobacterium atlanticum]
MRIFFKTLFFTVLFVSVACGKTLKDFMKTYVEKQYPEYKVLRVSAPNLQVDEKSKFKVSLESSDRYYLRFKVFGYFNGKEEVVPVSVRVVKLKNVVVAAKDILPGELITKDLLKLKRVSEFKAGNAFSSINEVSGKRAKRLIKSERIIKFTDVEPDYKVFKNTPVKVVYESGAIRIEMMGLALQNGALGDIIEVKNISTGKKILCKVVGNGVVKFMH